MCFEREVKTEMKKKQKRKEERMLDFELIRPVEPQRRGKGTYWNKLKLISTFLE